MAKTPTAFARLLVRYKLSSDEAARQILRTRKRGEPAASLSPGYVNQIANGHVPSLRLGRLIVRWATKKGARLGLEDLGIVTT